MCSRTSYNPEGLSLGSPLLVSNTSKKISIGGRVDGNQRWDEKTEWSSAAVAEAANLPVREILGKLRGIDENERDLAIKVLSELTLYVFSKSSVLPLSNLEARATSAMFDFDFRDGIEQEEDDDSSIDDEGDVVMLDEDEEDQRRIDGDGETSDTEICEST